MTTGTTERTPTREVSNCDWCRWLERDWTSCKACADGLRGRGCVMPRIRSGTQLACVTCNNLEGTCSYYAPSYWTRLLRRIGLRLPVY